MIIKLIQNKISKLLDSGHFIVFFGIISILPFTVISIFNNPAADDFCYNNKSQNLGFWNAQLSWYNDWSGRYFATAILSLKALVSGEFLIYKLIPIILLILLFISIYYLISLMITNLKKRDNYIITFFVLTLYLFQMPTISEGLYWLAGSITYQLSNILTVFLFYFLIKLITTNKKKYLIFSIFFSFLVVGSNETSMLLVNFIIGVIFIYKLIDEKKIHYPILILLTFTVLFAIIVITSPGNSIRASHFPNKNNFFYSAYKALFDVIKYLLKWLPFIIIFVLIFFNYFKKNIAYKKLKNNNVNPIIVSFVVFTIPFIGFFIGYWSMGHTLPHRTINVIYFYFLIGLIYLILILFFKFNEKENNFIHYSRNVKYLLFIVIFCLLGHENNVKTAYSDLVSGRAYNYDLELKKRYRDINSNTDKETLYVPELLHTPRTIFFSDITSDSNDWKNQCYDSYFKPKKIILKIDTN